MTAVAPTPAEARQRLLSLADGLEQLQSSEFNFTALVTRSRVSADGEVCGTVCCAIGWCPRFFPKHWYWDYYFNHFSGQCGPNLVPALIDSPIHRLYTRPSWITEAAFFFGISECQVISLFTTAGYDENPSSPRAPIVTRAAVTKRIRQFADGTCASPQ